MKIERCPVHEGRTDSDCEPCSQEISQAESYLGSRIRNNQMLESELRHLGGQVDPVIWLSLRLDMFIQGMLTDPKARIAFEIAYAQQAEDVLKTAKGEINRARLLARNGGQR